jgi:muramoyltetrapeptide carboxypeptidase
MSHKVGIGIVAPSSQTPVVEFTLGVEALRREGFNVFVHPQVKKSHWFFAGRDAERAQAFFDFAIDPRFPVLWCARGGYGAIRLLPLLERMTAERGIPEPKLLVGYSDATALLEYVRTRWGWATLHAPMPGLRKFVTLSRREWSAMSGWVRGEAVTEPWGKLKLVGRVPRGGVHGRLCGGNLSVWTALVGTPFAPRARGKIVFFEDIGESLARIDRMVSQLAFSGSLEGARAIVLGNFLDCGDAIARVLTRMPKSKAGVKSPEPKDLGPLRRRLDARAVILEIFAQLAEHYGIPLAHGLPAGHGPGHAPLPLGAEYRLRPDGRLTLDSWDWLADSRGGGSRRSEPLLDTPRELR